MMVKSAIYYRKKILILFYINEKSLFAENTRKNTFLYFMIIFLKNKALLKKKELF